eukprot:g2728.t1
MDADLAKVRAQQAANMQQSSNMQQQMQQIQEAKQKEMQMNEMKKAALKSVLTPDARARLDRIRAVKPEKATALEHFILQRKATNIDEKMMISLLEQMSAQERQTKVVYKRAVFSDSEDDNDDDLM